MDNASVPELSPAANSLQPGVYEHYKGNRYVVAGVCRHSETLEELVMYQAQYADHSWWVRPVKMFLESVQYEGKTVPRFRFLETTQS